MKLTVNNVFGFADADIELPQGAILITGKNSMGKTSLANIVGALVAHDDNPCRVSVTSKASYVRDGAQDGYAELNRVKWIPKSGMSIPNGSEPLATRHSAGLVDFIHEAKTRNTREKIWEELFVPDNPRELLEPVWTLPKAQLDAVVSTIERSGNWNEASKYYEDQRREYKRKWCEITGEQRYGDKKAPKWMPPNWSPDLEGASLEDLQREVVEARESVNAMTAIEAVSVSQIEEAQRIRDVEIPKTEARLNDATQRVSAYEGDLRNLNAEYAAKSKKVRDAESWASEARRILDARAPYTCPHCQGGLSLTDGSLAPWFAPSGEELEKKRALYDETIEKIKRAKDNLKSVDNDRRDLESQVNNARAEASEYRGVIRALSAKAAYADREEAVEVDSSARANAESRVREAQIRLDSFERRQLAMQHHDNVVKMDEICDLVGANGARAAHISDCLDRIRGVLNRISSITGWLPIDINHEYQITSSGRPVQMAAKNEQLKCQWAMQIACAYYCKDAWIILDEADTLRDESWDGLVKLVDALTGKNPKLRVLVCATSTVIDSDNWTQVQL